MTVFTYQYWHCPICLVLSIWCLQRTTPLQQLMTLSRVTWIFWVHIYKLLPLQSAPRPCLASCGFDPWHWKCLSLSRQGVSCMIFATQMSWMTGSESYMLWLSNGHLLLILLFSLYWEQEEHRKDITQVDKKEIDLDWRGKLCGDMPNAETILKNKVCVCQGTSGILSHWRPIVFTKNYRTNANQEGEKKAATLSFFYSRFFALVYFLRQPAVALLGNGELDTLATGQGHIGLVSLANDKDIVQPENKERLYQRSAPLNDDSRYLSMMSIWWKNEHLNTWTMNIMQSLIFSEGKSFSITFIHPHDWVIQLPIKICMRNNGKAKHIMEVKNKYK